MYRCPVTVVVIKTKKFENRNFSETNNEKLDHYYRYLYEWLHNNNYCHTLKPTGVSRTRNKN